MLIPDLVILKNLTIMKVNMGLFDRLIRIIAAIVIGYLYYAGIITGTGGLVLTIFAGVLVVTSILGICPVYRLLGIRTCSRND